MNVKLRGQKMSPLHCAKCYERRTLFQFASSRFVNQGENSLISGIVHHPNMGALNLFIPLDLDEFPYLS